MSNKKTRTWLIAAVVALGVIALAGLALRWSASEVAPAAEKTSPSKLESIDGSTLKRILLTEQAAQRIGLTTAAIQRGQAGKTTIPYSALVYDRTGQTWAYTQTKPLVYVREKVSVDTITGDQVILAFGPAVGTPVVTVGVAELYGAELGVGK